MSLRDRIKEWYDKQGENPFFNSRYPGDKQDPLSVQMPYNPHQKQVQLDGKNNIHPDHPLGNFRDNVTQWELINHNAKTKRLVTKAQAKQENLQKEFAQAVLQKDTDRVKQFLGQGYNPAQRYDQYNSPLDHASSPEMITLLLSSGASYKDLPDGGEKALSTWMGPSWNAFKVIIESGNPDPNKFSNSARTNPLAKASINGYWAAVDTLLSVLKMNPNTRFDDGTTPLMRAAMALDIHEDDENYEDDKEAALETMHHLLLAGADPSIKTKEGHTVQDILDDLNQSEVLDELQEEIEWNKLPEEEKERIRQEQKDKRNQYQLKRRLDEEKSKEEIQLDPLIEDINERLSKEKLTSNEVLDLYKDIKELEDSPQKNLLMQKFKERTQKVAAIKRLVKKSEVPTDFKVTDFTEKPKEDPEADVFKKKVKKYKQRREIQPDNTFTAEPKNGLNPSIYYKTPGVIL